MTRGDVFDPAHVLVDVALANVARTCRSFAEVCAASERASGVDRTPTRRIEQWTRLFVDQAEPAFVFTIG
jgi:hypothetical protein